MDVNSDIRDSGNAGSHSMGAMITKQVDSDESKINADDHWIYHQILNHFDVIHPFRSGIKRVDHAFDVAFPFGIVCAVF